MVTLWLQSCLSSWFSGSLWNTIKHLTYSKAVPQSAEAFCVTTRAARAADTAHVSGPCSHFMHKMGSVVKFHYVKRLFWLVQGVLVRVSDVCGNIKRPLTIRNLTKSVLNLKESCSLTFLPENSAIFPHQLRNNKLPLRYIWGKPITIPIGKWAALKILTEVLKI